MNEWSLTGVQGHPLHVHVNPHQLVWMSALDPKTGCDKEYQYHCVGDFHDTLQVGSF